MATKSFLKNVSLHNAKECQSFIKALEKSERQAQEKKEISTPVHEMTREQIRKVFGTEHE